MTENSLSATSLKYGWIRRILAVPRRASVLCEKPRCSYFFIVCMAYNIGFVCFCGGSLPLRGYFIHDRDAWIAGLYRE